MARLEPWAERADWVNPIRSAPVQPHLGEIVFPADSTSSYSDAKQQSERLLALYYCADREAIDRDLRSIDSYLQAPDKQIFIVEGDVGVGKTWFLRYNTVVRPRVQLDHRVGFVDLLHTPPGRVREALYRDLSPILDDYCCHVFGSSSTALYRFALHQWVGRVGGDPGAPTAEDRASAESSVHQWLQQDGEKYVERLLTTLELLPGPLLFIVLDNLDRAAVGDQSAILDIAVRVLRNHRIKLIVPLRRTSTLLRDRFTGLHEVRHQSMALSPLDPGKMIRLRFTYSQDGQSMQDTPIIQDGSRTYTFPEIHDLLFSGETGDLLRALAGHNARVALYCIERLLRSDQLRGIFNLANAQHVIASLMLAADYQPDDGALILNLFDNEENGRLGSALIRFRVLERLFLDQCINLAHRELVDHLEGRGYELSQVKRVLARFLMADMVELECRLTPSELLNLPPDKCDSLGPIHITRVGKVYVDVLLEKQWYFAAAKRGLAHIVPRAFRSFDEKNRYVYMSHSNLIDYLKNEEGAEKNRKARWQSAHARDLDRMPMLRAPHKYAERALLRKLDDDAQ